MWIELKPDFIGRDRFIETMMATGFRVKRSVSKMRTTFAGKVFYPNLIQGRKVRSPSTIWQSDITYINVNNVAYYAVFIIDVYSKIIVGYQVTIHMRASANVKALAMALKKYRAPQIHHSDRGSQYIDTAYRKMLTDKGIVISMCKEAWQNAYTERVNRTIKEEYLNEWKIENYQELTRSVAKAVKHYNNKRKHQALGYISPIDFEKQPDRVTMKLYKSSENPTQNGWVGSRK